MQSEREVLEFLKFELKFIENGGYSRAPHAPWKPTRIFQDSPSCFNFNQISRPHPCSKCWLMEFVPEERRQEDVPCWFIPVGSSGETVDYYSRCGTQMEMEQALAGWLRETINRIEASVNVQACQTAAEGPDVKSGT